MPGQSPTESPSRHSQTQRVELIAFPDAIGDQLRHCIQNEYGHDCLRFRSEKLAPDSLHGESLVRCIWVDPDSPAIAPEFQGISVAIGRGLKAEAQAKLISNGFLGVIDLQHVTVHSAAGLASAYAEQAASRSTAPQDDLGSVLSVDLSSDQSDEGTEYLAACVELLEIGVYALNEKKGGIFTVWNAQMERLFQKSKKEVLGKKVDAIFNDPLICNVFRETPATYSRNRAIIPSKARTRSNFIADISKTQLRESDGTPTATVGILQDVTSRIHSENRLIAAFNELESSKEKLEQSNLEIRKGIEKAKKLAVVAQSSNKAKSYFLSNISHELRTPLNSIVSLTHALLEGTFGDLNERQHENLEIVSDSSKHLHSLINDILDLSKIELGKMNLKFAPVSISDIARSSIRMIEQEAAQKNVRCIVEIDTEHEEIEADAKRLRQILLNLLVNAVKFTNPDTNVTLRIGENPDAQSVVFKVIDHGIGINKSDFSKIFSPFTQLDDSLSRQYEGTGLGLAIASKFVELHGGGLRVESEQNKGSTFTISLPVSQPAEKLDTAILPSLSEIATDARRSRNILLIVDENEGSALRIKNQVQQFSPFSPILTMPNEISAYHDQVAPQAIFVDLNIISSHGTDWIASAQKLPAWKRTKWIAIGSIDLPDNHLAASKLGFDACSCKPIPNSLLAKLLH
ncbi:ATP-binding protein [Pelagicoccus mobilis]|uniref:histidine kinase n=1 Tax=Pelagicoccus mobilis TaxID=415221 RepID=A0A934VP77_9BACT|nr:PAS domain-containing sensor histidine kinase [Pelagicoccus mobilis]MBK1876997.1 PAS domain-containing sensor histidine kinase [Pelagicoccus mobilis]